MFIESLYTSSLFIKGNWRNNGNTHTDTGKIKFPLENPKKKFQDFVARALFESLGYFFMKVPETFKKNQCLLLDMSQVKTTF